jgi:hypothetical protein
MKKTLTFLILLLLIGNVAFAGSPWMTEGNYTDKAVHKLGFGAKNLLLGWTALFTEPSHADDGENFVEGLGRGILYSVTNTVGGALHVITFPFTEIDVPLPGGGVDF